MAITAAQVKELRQKTGVGMMECKKALVENEGNLEKAILWLRERGLSRAAKKAGRTTAEGLVKILVADDSKSAVLVELNCETDFVSKNEDFQKFANDVAALALSKKINSVEALKAEAMNGSTVGDVLTGLVSTIGENLNLRRVSFLGSDNGVVAGYSHMGGKIGAIVLLDGSTDESLVALGKDVAMHAAASAPKYLNSSEVDATELEQEKDLAKKKLLEEGKPEALIEKILVGQMNKFYKEVCLLDQPFVKDGSVSVSKLVANEGKGASLTAFTLFKLGDGIEKKEEDFAAEVAATLKT